jgi:hypothetical protein
MKIRRNQIVFIFITIVLLVVLYRTRGRVEKYEKNLIKYIDTTKILDPVVVSESLSEITDNEKMVQRGWDLAEAQNHVKLRKLVTILQEFSD